jgi:hypothetical protein
MPAALLLAVAGALVGGGAGAPLRPGASLSGTLRPTVQIAGVDAGVAIARARISTQTRAVWLIWAGSSTAPRSRRGRVVAGDVEVEVEGACVTGRGSPSGADFQSCFVDATSLAQRAAGATTLELRADVIDVVDPRHGRPHAATGTHAGAALIAVLDEDPAAPPTTFTAFTGVVAHGPGTTVPLIAGAADEDAIVDVVLDGDASVSGAERLGARDVAFDGVSPAMDGLAVGGCCVEVEAVPPGASTSSASTGGDVVAHVFALGQRPAPSVAQKSLVDEVLDAVEPPAVVSDAADDDAAVDPDAEEAPRAAQRRALPAPSLLDRVDVEYRPLAGRCVQAGGAGVGAVVGLCCLSPCTAPVGVSVASSSVGLVAHPDAALGATVGAVIGIPLGLASAFGAGLLGGLVLTALPDPVPPPVANTLEAAVLLGVPVAVLATSAAAGAFLATAP